MAAPPRNARNQQRPNDHLPIRTPRRYDHANDTNTSTIRTQRRCETNATPTTTNEETSGAASTHSTGIHNSLHAPPPKPLLGTTTRSSCLSRPRRPMTHKHQERMEPTTHTPRNTAIAKRTPSRSGPRHRTQSLIPLTSWPTRE